MKLKIFYSILFITLAFGACTKLDVPPLNIVQDDAVFTNNSGLQIYMARMYSELPIEDFRYSPTRGLNFFWIISPFPAITGEALSRDQNGATAETFGYWAAAYNLIREANYMIQTLPTYAKNFSPAEVSNYLGEARFIRGVTYFALAKRYGGVPIVNKLLNYPQQTIEQLRIPRSSEEAVYDSIGADMDFAYANMAEKSDMGRANRYAAAAFKSRAMVFAGSIAKYNQITLTDANQNRVAGIAPEKAVKFFKQAYDAAKLLDGKYSLYKKNWAAGDKQAQYVNYTNLFFDAASSENIFVKMYKYPESVHGYDSYNVPRQSAGANGYSSEVNPTLDYVEMFDGLPKNANGTLQTMDANGKYLLYTNTMDLFANAEPRLRATVIFPGDEFKGENIEIRRGIYTADASGGISALLPAGSTANYPTANIVSSSNANQTPYKLPDGTLMNPAGLSGPFTSDFTSAISGFNVRKWLNPSTPKSEVLENRAQTTWIEIRYAEVLLNLAEAAYELSLAGQTGTYLQDAFTTINTIRDRAGANLLPNASALTTDVVRMERRKEMGFENKTWWDMRRWRIADREQNGTLYRVLMPFYSATAKKYFFDSRFDERNVRYTFDPRWYYEQIPQGEIIKSPNIIQNPGY
ncbi:MAG: RagB/SusD family nutrient uptake outer membrane protein [Chitinophagaceae bacterium]